MKSMTKILTEETHFTHLVGVSRSERTQLTFWLFILILCLCSAVILRFSRDLCSSDGVHVQLRRSARAAPTELHEMRVSHMNKMAYGAIFALYKESIFGLG